MTNIRQELPSMQANDLLNDEPDEKEIMKQEVVKMDLFMFSNITHRWKESLKTRRWHQYSRRETERWKETTEE